MNDDLTEVFAARLGELIGAMSEDTVIDLHRLLIDTGHRTRRALGAEFAPVSGLTLDRLDGPALRQLLDVLLLLEGRLFAERIRRDATPGGIYK